MTKIKALREEKKKIQAEKRGVWITPGSPILQYPNGKTEILKPRWQRRLLAKADKKG